jgi:hypothetical protein
MMKFAAFLAQFSLFFAFFDSILALKCPAADQNGRPLPEPVTVTYNEALGCLDLLSLGLLHFFFFFFPPFFHALFVDF